MPVRLIGPVVISAAEPVPVTAAKRACVLAVLAARPGVPVSRADLIDRVWDGAPPETVTSVLYSYITRLRADLKHADATIRRAGSHGYLLDADPETVDVHRIRAMAARAADTGSLELWREVCASARGEVLAGVTGRWAKEFRDGFGHERRGWFDARYAAELAAGNDALVADELIARAAGEVLTEPLVAHLMLALHRRGRSAEALRWFEATRLRLRDGLGADPSPALRDLHVRILGQDPDLLASGTDGGGRAPAMLPAGIPSFTGRARQLDALSALAGREGPVLLTGHAGAGKTALIVHWGQSRVDDFSGGLLYVNLRGFDRGDPVSPREALGRLLLALGVGGEAVPGDVDAAAELFRSRTSGRRMLVVLDNAGTAEQVRPLLPGAGCFTVVTSRDKLPGLVAVDDARVIDVGVLPREDSTLLLRRLLGDDADPSAIDDLARLCGDLPLALRIGAANVAGGFNGRIVSYVEELRRDRLALLAVDGDADAAVTAALDLSHADLDTATRRLFARLGAIPGESLGEHLVLAVSGLEPEAARRALRRLAARHLIEQYKPRLYRMHDLVRLHAAARAEAELGEEERTEVVEAFIEALDANRVTEDIDEELGVFPAVEALEGHPRLWRLIRRLATALAGGRFVDRCRVLVHEGLRRAERDGDAEGVFELTMMASNVDSAVGDVDACLERLREAVGLAAGLGLQERIRAKGTYGLRMLDRDHRTSAALIGEVVDLAVAEGDTANTIVYRRNMAYVSAPLGRFATAARHLHEVAAAMDGSLAQRARTSSGHTWLLFNRRADAALLDHSAETIGLAREMDRRITEALMLLYRSIALRRLGRAADALAEIQDCRGILRAGHMVLLRPDLELANAYTAVGEPGNALDILAAVERAWPTMPRLDRSDYEVTLARAHRANGDLDIAATHARRAASAYEAIAARVPQADALDVLAGILSTAGRDAEADAVRAALATLVGEFEEGWEGPGR
ncbi:AfsR/SARP family transcriptional regulator [Phytomonospora endophytica]|uniref:DNA-binding SARP family transcriptional activator/tetratricopeptide (TPR) repeat protein n=1 Tax=Phytomonospora endophytica TaxID=714109 RepID=A0A841FCQ4_9ACTN|nr:BTAD domain-containing putative transcriptional regulator [Phytomonospora endophytica]MBB6035071.1 DNA-binding SARP family transcriptional activator/tetratricopeptide (TPR) repeat protein [Phytomonospora endophytica]GIG64181.1 hypothetical protein Pen01_04760 [Phytomonospora endophytica]